MVTPAMQQYFNDQRTDGPSDTVGAIALDSNGNVAAATSTSGTPYKPAARFEKLFGKSMSALIVIDRDGNLGAAQIAPKMTFGWVDDDGQIQTAMHTDTLKRAG